MTSEKRVQEFHTDDTSQADDFSGYVLIPFFYFFTGLRPS